MVGFKVNSYIVFTVVKLVIIFITKFVQFEWSIFFRFNTIKI